MSQRVTHRAQEHQPTEGSGEQAVGVVRKVWVASTLAHGRRSLCVGRGVTTSLGVEPRNAGFRASHGYQFCQLVVTGHSTTHEPDSGPSYL